MSNLAARKIKISEEKQKQRAREINKILNITFRDSNLNHKNEKRVGK